MSAERSADELTDAIAARTSDVERGTHDLELRLAEATTSAQAYKSEAAEAVRRAEEAEENAAAQIEAFKKETRAAVERARADAVEAVRRATGSTSPAPSPRADVEGDTPLEVERLGEGEAGDEGDDGPGAVAVEADGADGVWRRREPAGPAHRGGCKKVSKPGRDSKFGG